MTTREQLRTFNPTLAERLDAYDAALDRSWAAIMLSVVALILSIVSLYGSH